MSKTLRVARCLMIAALSIYWPSIALGTHVPEQAVRAQVSNDKVMHIGAFLVLAFLLTWCVMYRRPTVRRTILVLGIVVLYGVVDEVTQMLVPSRHADLYDWLADCCGAVAGLAAYFVSLQILRFVLPPSVAGWTSNSSPAVGERN